MVKREFLFLPQRFQKSSTAEASASVYMWERVGNTIAGKIHDIVEKILICFNKKPFSTVFQLCSGCQIIIRVGPDFNAPGLHTTF